MGNVSIAAKNPPFKHSDILLAFENEHKSLSIMSIRVYPAGKDDKWQQYANKFWNYKLKWCLKISKLDGALLKKPFEHILPRDFIISSR
ncbi:10220_t:CDS:2 [Gigaspora rosea]|nr:10220_t:CDS:2 [Gigaspora rosea]